MFEDITVEEQKANLKNLISKLRNPYYKNRQTTGRLVRWVNGKQCYCIMGLASKLTNQFKLHETNMEHKLSNDSRSLYYSSHPPVFVHKFYGLTEQRVWALMRKNDNGVPFKKIADYIEANYL